MRKISLILLLMAALLLVGCSLPGGATYDNTDIIPVEGQAGLYTDARLAFCSEIRGVYAADRPFALDAEHPSLRVWDDIYLYEGDYFQLVASGSADIFFAVKVFKDIFDHNIDTGSVIYVEEHKSLFIRTEVQYIGKKWITLRDFHSDL